MYLGSEMKRLCYKVHWCLLKYRLSTACLAKREYLLFTNILFSQNGVNKRHTNGTHDIDRRDGLNQLASVLTFGGKYFLYFRRCLGALYSKIHIFGIFNLMFWSWAMFRRVYAKCSSHFRKSFSIHLNSFA